MFLQCLVYKVFTLMGTGWFALIRISKCFSFREKNLTLFTHKSQCSNTGVLEWAVIDNKREKSNARRSTVMLYEKENRQGALDYRISI